MYNCLCVKIRVFERNKQKKKYNQILEEIKKKINIK